MVAIAAAGDSPVTQGHATFGAPFVLWWPLIYSMIIANCASNIVDIAKCRLKLQSLASGRVAVLMARTYWLFVGRTGL
jgi:hypothetical protein